MINTAVARKESCAPARNSSAGCQMSTATSAAARAVIPWARRPVPAARQASQTTIVARTTGVRGPTKST